MEHGRPSDGVVVLETGQVRLDPDAPVNADREGEAAARDRSPVAPQTAGRPRQMITLVAYLPEAEFEAAWEQHLLDATMYRAHVDYRRELQTSLMNQAATPGGPIFVMPLDIPGLLAFAEHEGRDPASRRTRLAYNRTLQGSGLEIPWPPPRNGPCWCGSGHKYKKCCGAPEFRAVEMPDPASLVLKIELDGVEPPVWRRVAVPSNIHLDELHNVINRAMGWDGWHLYEFEDEKGTFVSSESHGPGYPAVDNVLVSIADEPGHQFTYVYDLGDWWTHTVTLEEIRAGGDDNVPQHLDGAGACPPEDCGGAARYMALLRAFDDPTHPLHDEAVDWLREAEESETDGGDWDTEDGEAVDDGDRRTPAE
jgi:hypothetical protein